MLIAYWLKLLRKTLVWPSGACFLMLRKQIMVDVEFPGRSTVFSLMYRNKAPCKQLQRFRPAGAREPCMRLFVTRQTVSLDACGTGM